IKGNITVHMKNVPWDQALETILDTNGLGMKRTGNVISVFTREKMQKAVEERLKEDVAQGKRPQVLIEAKILETTASFARKLGVQWGTGFQTGNVWTGQSARILPSGLTPLTRNLGVRRGTYAVNETSPYSGGTYGVNLADFTKTGIFPSLGTATVSPTFGLIVGTAKNFVDLDISASESMGETKILSAPKVVTFDGTAAYITQGSEIPYVFTDKEGNRSIQWKEATLKLDVTPAITDENRIVLKIKAKNDAPDYATKAQANLDNPPINKSEVSSTIVVNDGDTVVVGGIRKVNENKQEGGVPWLKDIPIIGWMFKSEDISKEQKELLIFITPKVVQEKK
ncbi:MAG TPA: secretin and TonB N-terminal domain-containing protein, partial [Syntrophales bacterium]|nr:secretin and TonB N-terminal domain-containing protein [Syntrophales bacterium]